MRRGRAITSLGLCALLWLGPPPATATGSSDRAFEAQPGTEVGAEALEAVFETAVELERSVFEAQDPDPGWVYDRLARAALLFERVGDQQGGVGPGYWRAARSTWLSGETLPLDDVDGRVERFERSLALADRGLAANPDCAECMLWKFISMGRLRTTLGVFEGVRQVSEMAELLERAIELEPTHRDSEDNSTLGNLHYSSAIFYRLLPDWFWIGWVLGVKGDKKRALRHARRALELHPNRLDYRIEVGTQLLCLGSDRGDAERIEEGRRVIRDAIAHVPTSEDERREIHFARIMLEHPERSCGYTGDKLIEIDEDAARRAGG